MSNITEHNKKEQKKTPPKKVAKKKPVKKKMTKATKKKMLATRAFNKEQLRTKAAKIRMLEALKKTLGVVTPALTVAEVGRTQYYEWLKKDSEFKASTQEFLDISLDYSENALFGLIKSKNVAAVIFHLKTKGKERGYVERSEFEHKVEPKELDLSKLSTPDLNSLEKILEKAKTKDV